MKAKGAGEIIPIDNFLEAQYLCDQLEETLPQTKKALMPLAS
jgi:hypothetical protein